MSGPRPPRPSFSGPPMGGPPRAPRGFDGPPGGGFGPPAGPGGGPGMRDRRPAKAKAKPERPGPRGPIRERSGGDETLAASGVDQERAQTIRELVRIVQESGVGEITIEENGMRVSVRRTPDHVQTVPAVIASAPGEEPELPPVAPRDDAFVRVESPRPASACAAASAETRCIVRATG